MRTSTNSTSSGFLSDIKPSSEAISPTVKPVKNNIELTSYVKEDEDFETGGVKPMPDPGKDEIYEDHHLTNPPNYPFHEDNYQHTMVEPGTNPGTDAEHTAKPSYQITQSGLKVPKWAMIGGLVAGGFFLLKKL